MPRKPNFHKRELVADPKTGSTLVTRFVNYLMRRGKRSTAEHILYGAIDLMAERTGQDGISVLKQAINNVKPNLEVKSRRVGGATYQVPVEVRPDRALSLAIRWLLVSARSRPGKSMAEKLAAEFMDAAKGQGATIKKRDDTHKMAEANRAFAHYRW